MRITRDCLTPALRLALDGLMTRDSAQLPEWAPWPSGTHAKSLDVDYGPGGGYDPRYRVDRQGKSWTFIEGVSDHGMKVVWQLEVEASTGAVFARPTLRGKVVSGPTPNAEELGFVSREIGSIGRIEPIFPPQARHFLTAHGLPNIHTPATDAAQARADLAEMLLAHRS